MKEINVNVSVKCNFNVPVFAKNENDATVIARFIVDELLANSRIDTLNTWEELGFSILSSKDTDDYNEEDVIM